MIKRTGSTFRLVAVALAAVTIVTFVAHTACALSARTVISLFGEVAGDQFGLPVRSAGDVNGDGYADVVVAAIHHGVDSVNVGRVYVYFGGQASATSTATDTGT